MATTSKTRNDLSALAPGKWSAVASMLNGAGNMLMLAALPTLLTSEETRKNHRLAFGVATGISAVLGAIWGWNEARQIKTYRNALLEEITELHSKVETLEAERDSWRGKISEEKREQAIVAEPQVY